jgi:DNA primase
MDASEAEELLRGLGSDKFSQSTNGGWLRATCPLATWRHKGGKDSHPSFAISVEPGGESHYKCLSCGAKGSMLAFVWQLEKHSNRKFPALFDYVTKTNTPSPSNLASRLDRVGYGNKAAKEVAGIRVGSMYQTRTAEELVVLEESVLDAFEWPQDEVLDYLKKNRKQTDASIAEWELMWNPVAKRIMVPIRDHAGKLVATSGRAFYDWQRPKYMHSKGFKRDYYVYGEHRVPQGARGLTGYLTEGFFDVIRLAMYGYSYPFAIMGSHVSPFQVEKIVKLFDRVVIVPDGDKAGYESAEKAQKVLQTRIPCRTVNMPEGFDPDDLTEEQAHRIIGDPNENKPLDNQELGANVADRP